MFLFLYLRTNNYLSEVTTSRTAIFVFISLINVDNRVGSQSSGAISLVQLHAAYVEEASY
jgi:hypothetical protein